MTSLFDPMTSSSSPALDMLEGALDTEKSSDLQERKGGVSTHASPEPESVTVTVSTVRDDPSVAGASCLGSQSNHTQSYADPNAIQFQYRTDTNLENNHVHTSPTYDSGHIRVVQVHSDEGDPTVDRVDVAVSGNNFVPSSHVAQQTVIQSPFPESPPTQVDTDSGRFTYYSSGGSEQGTTAQGENIDSNTAYIVRTVPVSGLSQPSSPIPATNVIPVTQGAQGQFYVMMPQDVLQSGNQRTIAPRSHPSNQKMDGQRTPRDEKRRATHNEVERRRRDKINNWIEKLAKMLPESEQDHTKQGQSKGGVLGKAVDYIHDLRAASARMADVLKENERLSIDVELLRQQYEEATKENAMLRTQLQQHGLEPVSTSTTAQPH